MEISSFSSFPCESLDCDLFGVRWHLIYCKISLDILTVPWQHSTSVLPWEGSWHQALQVLVNCGALLWVEKIQSKIWNNNICELLSALGEPSLDVFCTALGGKQFRMHPRRHTVCCRDFRDNPACLISYSPPFCPHQLNHAPIAQPLPTRTPLSSQTHKPTTTPIRSWMVSSLLPLLTSEATSPTENYLRCLLCTFSF